MNLLHSFSGCNQKKADTAMDQISDTYKERTMIRIVDVLQKPRHSEAAVFYRKKKKLTF
ncbi:hypothetical protein O2313_15470 [Bacillus amyloliquefaciens]|uniref:hypothetical protein n=1 Tax=Bacillus amyloliquefaciens TaxID=1390 RepID=UPI0022AFB6DD|nr:hypothetical protein [Bacillus amyloliquefaciens]MCZ4248919.1 hypothetical protein [Bacillus amyloliquefaciens]